MRGPRYLWPVAALAAGGLLTVAARAQNTVTPTATASPVTIQQAPPGTTPPTASSTPGAVQAPVAAPALPAIVTPEEAAPPTAEAPVASAAKPDAAPPTPEPPQKRPRFASAILQATDKITAETLRFEAKIGENLRYKGLIVTVRACETTAPDEELFDSIANVEVLSQPQGMAGGAPAPARSVYKGWMFASSPSLHPFEHPVYDLWLISCRTSAPVGAPAAPAPAPRHVATPKVVRPAPSEAAPPAGEPAAEEPAASKT